jgi:inhibitor of cysteine peptidase
MTGPCQRNYLSPNPEDAVLQMHLSAIPMGLRTRVAYGLKEIRQTAVLALVLVAFSVAGVACGNGSETPVYTRDTRTIKVEPGEQFRINLHASPGIGDDWRVVGGLERGTVKLVDDSYRADDPGLPGGSGSASFLFEATRSGATDLTLFNCYRCAGDNKPLPENARFAETVVFTVTIS